MSTDSATTETRPATGHIGLWFVLIAGVAIAGGLWLGLTTFGGPPRPAPPPVLQAGTMLPQPKPLADFVLTDQDGHPFSLANLSERWTFLAIGYTYCPDICLMTLATFDAIKDGIVEAAAERGDRTPAQFLFVSVDPERDTPERLSQYVRYFDPVFLGATGDEAQLQALTAQLGLLYARVEGQETAMGYSMDHSGSILLVDPLGRLAAIFSRPHDPSAMSADFHAIETDYEARP